MNLPPNGLITLTKNQRKGNAIVTALIGLVLAIIIQYFGSLPGESIPNTGWAEIYDNFSTIAMILFILLFYRKEKT